MIDKGSFSSLRYLSDCTQPTNNFYHSQSLFLNFFYLYGCQNEVYFAFFHSSSFQNTLASQTLYYKVQGVRSISCLRPHHRESTGSRQITEVNLGRASIVLGWVTAWEQLVLQTFFFFLAENFGEYAMIDKGSFSSLRQLSDCTQRTNNFYHSQSRFLYFSIFMVVPMKFISHFFTARVFKTHLLLKRLL